MPTKLQLKKNLEEAVKTGHMSSGGMRILHCSVDIDAVGKVSVSVTLSPGGLPKEAVEALIMKAFESVGMAAFVKDGQWQDIDISHEAGTVKIEAYGFM